MAKSLRELAEGVRAFEKSVRSVVALGEFLDGVANIEQLASEAQARADQAAVAEKAALAKAAAAQEKHADVVVKIQSAREQLAKDQNEASARATEFIVEAKSEGEALLRAAKALVLKESETLESTRREIVKARQELAETQAAVAAVGESLNAVKQAAAQIASR